MPDEYDVVVSGGSLAGLFTARELALNGLRTLVLEEDREIGHPEKCDGLVSMEALRDLGVVPRARVVQNRIRRALLHSPSGVTVELNAERQRVVVLDRSEFDRELAREARSYGMELAVGERVTGRMARKDHVLTETEQGRYRSRYTVDARGIAARTQNKKGILHAARYEVHASWIQEDTVELFFDQGKTPGFFTWIIPINTDTAKIGTAGYGINTFRTLDAFLAARRRYSIVKKIAAPILVSGTLSHFVDGLDVIVGDAAGQCKPTTAGGIYTGGMGGMLAGDAIARALLDHDPRAVQRYQPRWNGLFGQEFRVMGRARRLFERLDNRQLDHAFDLIARSELPQQISADGSFDRHSIALLRAFGLRGLAQTIGLFALTELRTFVQRTRKQKTNPMTLRGA